MRKLITIIIVVMCACAGTSARQPQLDTAAISKALGREGRMQGDVYRVSFPRSDLRATVAGVAIKPGLALGSWVAFRRTPKEAVVHGDLVLLDGEVNPVISKLQEGGLSITALHNHVIDITPHVMYLHIWGTGTEAALAQTVRAALDLTKTPMQPPAPSAPAPPDFDADTIQKILGVTGTVNGGVLGISVPRPEKIVMMGVEMPPSMGMATVLNFQASPGGNVAATGDYVMTGEQVNKVARALRQHGVAITALHNHMIHGSPELYFMHFWANDTPSKVATALKAGFDAMK
jgi:Domain of Unknown Function (DUF1259)